MWRSLTFIDETGIEEKRREQRNAYIPFVSKRGRLPLSPNNTERGYHRPEL
jgi:hypothetical protein